MTPASPPAVEESAGTRAQGASLPFRHRLSAARLCVLLLRYRLPETLAVRGSLFTGAGAGGETTSESSLLLPKWLEHTGLLWRWCSVRGRCGCAWMEEPAVVLCLLCLCCLPAVSRHVLTINTRCCFALVPTWLYFCSVSPCIRQGLPLHPRGPAATERELQSAATCPVHGRGDTAPAALAGKGPAPLGRAACSRAPAEALARGGLLPAGGRAAGGLVPAAQGCSCLPGTMTALLGIALGASQTSGVTLNGGVWIVLCSCVCPLEGAVGPFLCHGETVPEAMVGAQHRDGHAASLGMASNQE